jgi:hypothetical protein
MGCALRAEGGGMNRAFETRLRRLEAARGTGRARVVTIYSGTPEEADAELARLHVAGETGSGDVVIKLTGYPGAVRSCVDGVEMAHVMAAVDGGTTRAMRPALVVRTAYRGDLGGGQ